MNYEAIAQQANDAADTLDRSAKRDARQQHNCRIFSRGFEFLSLDASEERDEEIVDYAERDEITAELIEQMAEQCRNAGSKYLAIGYGVDCSESQSHYDDGDYEPMFDWVDLDNIALS